MRLGATTLVAMLLAAGPVLAPEEGRILERAPESPDPAARYLFYLHGRIIEVQGPTAVSPEFGAYDFDGILKAFAERGFSVIVEVREDGAGREFAVETARQVRDLLQAGVPPRRITVVGFSKGGMLTVGVSTIVGADEVGYVILAGCTADERWVSRVAPRVRGRFLSLFDRSDRLSPSCTRLFEEAEQLSETEEHVFETGLDHGLFYRPREDWVERVTDWAREAGSGSGSE